MPTAKQRHNPVQQAALVRAVFIRILHDQKVVSDYLDPIGVSPKTFRAWVDPALNFLDENANVGHKRGPKAKAKV